MEEPQSIPALVKNPSTGSCPMPDRRVAFELPPHLHSVSSKNDISSSIDHLDKGRYHPHCFACCAWSCITLFIIIVVLLFVGISYLGFLKAGMPVVNVRAFNITKLEVNDGTQKMDAVVFLGLKISNKNEKFKLLYEPLLVDVSSVGVALGKTEVNGFSQMPMNETKLDMTMTLDNADVDKYAADELKSDIKAHEMVFDVYVSGRIGFEVGSMHMNKVPFLVSCLQIKKMDVDFGRRPECEVKIFTLRPSSN